MTAVKRTLQAEEDLISIWLYVAVQSPLAADRLLDRFEKRFRQIAAFPESGSPRDDILPGSRQLVIGEYLTFYRVEGDTVLILRVFHGRRQIEPDDLTE